MQTRCEGLFTGCVGYSSIDGKTVMLEGVLPGETVEYDSIIKKGGAFVPLNFHRTDDSPLRRAVSCPYYGQCGGCDFAYVSAEDSAKLKSDVVKRNIERSTGEDISSIMQPPLWGPGEGYRMRCRIHLSMKDRKLGFLSRKSNTLLEMDHCPMLTERLDGVLSNSRELFRSAQSLIFQKGVNKKTGFVELSLFDADDSVLIENQMGVKTIGPYRFHVSGNVFFQSNAYLLEKLLEIVKSETKGERIMDLYSGVGTFSTIFEGEERTVWAVERDRLCLSLARKNAPSAKYFTDDVALWARKADGNVDTVIVDPPRTGLGDAAPLISSWNAGRIIYVSCNSASLARDLVHFKERYSLKSVRVIDFYPGSGHEETVAILDRR